MPAKVIVTGANGLIGRLICSQLESDGYDVTRIDVLPEDKASLRFEKDKDQQNPILKYQYKGKYFVADVAKKQEIENIIKQTGNVSVMIHLAAALETLPPDVIQTVNEVGTENILELCKENNIGKVIFASSLMVLWDTYSLKEPYCSIKKNSFRGDAASMTIISEDEVQNESDFGETLSIAAYKNSKIRNEALAKSFAAQGMSVMGLRLGAINPKDKPIVDAWAFCSHADLRQFASLAVKYIMTARTVFNIFHVCSDNPLCWVSLDKAKKLLGYIPHQYAALPAPVSAGRLSITQSFTKPPVNETTLTPVPCRVRL